MQATIELKEHDTLTEWSEECGCPRHGGGVKKVYRFGQYEDADVVVFHGCKCAVCINVASLSAGVPLGHEYTYHKCYQSAAGRATLIKMQESAANAPFCGRG